MPLPHKTQRGYAVLLMKWVNKQVSGSTTHASVNTPADAPQEGFFNFYTYLLEKKIPIYWKRKITIY